LKSRCQSSNDGLHSVKPGLVVCRGRPETGQRRHVGARWRPCAGRGPTSQTTGPSRTPRTGPCPSLAPLLPSHPLRARAEHRGAIATVPFPHARAPSSLSLGSTTSTPFRERLSEGEATLLAFAATAAFGTSPKFEATVVRAARSFSSLPFPLVSFPVTPGNLEWAWLRR
jgi:hypothetical protein